MTADINLTPTGSYLNVVFDEKDNTNACSKYISHLVGRSWGTASVCRAAALLIHGLGAHSGWFEAFGRRLKVRQIFALAYDQVGFGKRHNEHFFSREQWLADVEIAYNYVKSLVGDKPIYLMGNSMGAVVALQAAAKVKPAGLVMFSPGFNGHPNTFKIWYRIKCLIQALLNPNSKIDLPYTIEAITSDKAVRQWLSNDLERRFQLPARVLLELLRLTQEIEKNCKNIDYPVLMFTGGMEKIIDLKTTRRIFDQLPCANKISKHFPTAWHDLMFDDSIDNLTDEIVQWIGTNVPNHIAVTSANNQSNSSQLDKRFL